MSVFCVERRQIIKEGCSFGQPSLHDENQEPQTIYKV